MAEFFINVDKNVVECLNNLVKITQKNHNVILADALVLYTEKLQKELLKKKEELIEQKKEEEKLRMN